MVAVTITTKVVKKEEEQQEHQPNLHSLAICQLVDIQSILKFIVQAVSAFDPCKDERFLLYKHKDFNDITPLMEVIYDKCEKAQEYIEKLDNMERNKNE